MDDRALQFRVGMMVLVVLLAMGILFVMFGEMPKLLYGEYTLQITFVQAPGVNEGTPVRKSGILIGRVRKVDFDEDGTHIVVTAAIRDQWKVYSNEVCRVQGNILGDSALEFVRDLRSGAGAKKELLVNGAKLKGADGAEPSEMIESLQGQFNATAASVTRTSQSLRDASLKLTETLDTLNVMLGENRQGIRLAVNQANDVLAGAKAVVGDEATQAEMRKAMQKLPKMVDDTHAAVNEMRDAIAIVKKNLYDINEFTAPLGKSGKNIVANLELSTEKINDLIDDVARLMQSSNGTIGQLLHNPELYNRIVRAARNVEEVSQNLKPIVEDVHVFTDKIARHPETLGARGAIKPSPGIK